MTKENLEALIQVIVLLPLVKNPSSHDTVRVTVVSTGNVVEVVRCVQAGSSPVHVSVKVLYVSITDIKNNLDRICTLHKNELYMDTDLK